MQNFKTTIALDKIHGAERIEHNGKKGTFIPDAENDVFVSEKGYAYITFVNWLNRTGVDQRGNTHSVKVSTKPDFAQRFPQYSGQNAPIVGNSRPMQTRMQQASPAMPYAQPQPQWGQQYYPQQPKIDNNPFS